MLCFRTSPRLSQHQPPSITMKLLVLSLILTCLPSLFGLSIRAAGKRAQGFSGNSHRSSPLAAGIPWDYEEDVMARDAVAASEQSDLVVRLIQKIAELEALNGVRQSAIKRGTLWSSLRGPLPLDARFNDGTTQDTNDLSRNLKTMRYGRK
jgi:hypothetical protein